MTLRPWSKLQPSTKVQRLIIECAHTHRRKLIIIIFYTLGSKDPEG